MNNWCRNLLLQLTMITAALMLPVSMRAAEKVDVDSILGVLDAEIERYDEYAAPKERLITSLRHQFDIAVSDNSRFSLCQSLFMEYRYYRNDSAYAYACRLEQLAEKIGDPEKIAWAALCKIFCCSISGIFGEAQSAVEHFNPSGLPDYFMAEYCCMMMFYYEKLSEFSTGIDQLTQFYNQRANALRDSIFNYSTDKDVYQSLIRGNDNLRIIPAFNHEGIGRYKSIIESRPHDSHQLAMIYFPMYERYAFLQMDNEKIYYLALSAINDIRSCTRETAAITDLATLMAFIGQLDRASKYIRIAARDAIFFNSRFRRLRVGDILPGIEAQRYQREKSRQQLFVVLFLVAAMFVAFAVAMAFVLHRKNVKLSNARDEVARKSSEIDEANMALSQANAKLSEANEIKDRYIIESLYSDSSFVNNVEEKFRLIERKIRAKQYADLDAIVGNLGIKQERRRMSSAFDTAFLKLFPGFIDQFNRLFPPEHHFKVSDSGTLPTEIRIFALMRLGIDDAALVAKYLGISLNTIYVYKAKTKALSLVPKEEFDARIMAIPKQ